jgi:hypothetical protein
MSLSCKESVIDKPEYTVYFERYQGRVWMHCDVREWSLAVMKRLRQDWDYLFSLYGHTFYALNEPEGCEKRHKFMVAMGFEIVSPIEIVGGMGCIYRRVNG